MTTPNRLRWRTMATRHDGEQRQQRHVDEGFYGCLPSSGSPSRPVAAAAVLGQQRLDAFVQAGLRKRVRHDGAGEEEQRRAGRQSFSVTRLKPACRHMPRIRKPDAERVGDAGRMHAGEDVRHAHEPERADDA